MTKAIGVKARVLPATDDPVRTKIETPDGVLGFQEFFVRERWQPDVRSVTYLCANEARASTPVLRSIRESELVIISPRKHITSIDPILAIQDARYSLRCTRADVVSVRRVMCT